MEEDEIGGGACFEEPAAAHRGARDRRRRATDAQAGPKDGDAGDGLKLTSDRPHVDVDGGPPAREPIVPVRMTEAWLLFDETAIRASAGNPRGEMALDLPKVGALEALPDPKVILFEAIRRASGLTGRRLEKLRPAECRHRLAECIADFAPLRRLAAFAAFERATKAMLTGLVAP